MRKAHIAKTGSSRQVSKTQLVQSRLRSAARGPRVGKSQVLGRNGILKDKEDTQQRVNDSLAGEENVRVILHNL